MLEIKNLVVQIEDNRILNGLNLTVNDGEVAAIMGPNGSGKSTLSYVIAGKEDYEVLDGEILLDGQNVLENGGRRARRRRHLPAFQYPLEIPGVGTMTFLKACLNAQRKARGEDELSTPEFIRAVNGAADKLEINKEMLKRALKRRLLRRREEAHGDPADGAAAAEVLRARRDRFRPSTSTLRIVSEGVNALRAQGPLVSSSSPTISAPQPHRARHRAYVMVKRARS